MLINLSNHSSSTFSVEQFKAASAYGNVIDVPFPNINPHLSSTEVDQLALSTLTEIIEKYGKDCTIHVMGELNFCFSFVKYAQHHNIKCVSSTTERKVTETADGNKTSQFKFVAFREYI